MTLIVQLTIIILGILLLFAIILAAIQKKITEPHALCWILPCIFIILGGIFPQLTYFLSDLFNTSYPPAIIFAIAIIMLYVILFQCFKTLSVLSTKNNELTSIVAMQDKVIKDLEKKVDKLANNKD